MALTANIRSLPNKIAEMTDIVYSKENRLLGVVMWQETWLHREIDDNVVSLDNYLLFRSDRSANPRNCGGGVITYVNKNWCSSPTEIFR